MAEVAAGSVAADSAVVEVELLAEVETLMVLAVLTVQYNQSLLYVHFTLEEDNVTVEIAANFPTLP